MVLECFKINNTNYNIMMFISSIRFMILDSSKFNLNKKVANIFFKVETPIPFRLIVYVFMVNSIKLHMPTIIIM